MEKEITPEIKAKVFAQYAGQNVFKHYDQPVCVRWNFANFQLEGWKLILNPLSAITDEDAIEVAKFQYTGKDAPRLYHNVETGKCSAALCNADHLCGFAYQYLQSKGYDLPHHLLGGKTLRESGLCIYSQSEGTK